MKRTIVLFIALLLVLTGCGQNKSSYSKETKTFETKSGDKIKIPKNPKRIVVLTSNGGNFKDLGVTPVGIDADFPKSKYVNEKGSKRISSEDVESVAKLKPDLILTYDVNTKIKKYKKIAPTIPIKYTDYSYKEMHLAIGKILGKEQKAKDQIKDLENQLRQDGQAIEQKIGKNKTFTVMEIQPKQLSIFGENFGRGTPIIYQEYKFPFPKGAKEGLAKNGFKKVPYEKYNKYAADYVLIPTDSGKVETNDFTKSELWKNQKAYKNRHVYYYSKDNATYSNPSSLEKLSNHFKNILTKKST
ncbi:ABC transporter substrate-binding protein [Staphylococcus pseudoxylosus]|uniref:Iron-siderophore ABC transporter substrate-binding protein n=1 Tax=Staphylococcus pseudoxylosus TaxID=2282419 RepID=A0AAQ0S8I6_9STAP|nr:ABC transporter substrate-binding protein [Staphylococcus pseudoxylosus]MCE5001765.1 ABC transporter substrate-binding protein [Staphylococcus pseudoxylosus]RMI86461.1 iron-siderophore ABC transporter substrate-binding protein [Staphylococcus pseudoxylosus]